MIYRYTPTGHGFLARLTDANLSDRDSVCALYPDNDRRKLLSEEDFSALERYPFRPVVLAKLAPKYELDLGMISGLCGYGRIAAVKEGEARWVDEFGVIETEYRDGMLIYSARDGFIGDGALSVRIIPTAGSAGMIMDIGRGGTDPSVDLYLIHGGMLGWNVHSPLKISFLPEMCRENRICFGEGTAEIAVSEEEGELCFPETPISRYSKYDSNVKSSTNVSSAWLHIPGWRRRAVIRAENGEFSAAPPDALISFDPSKIKRLMEANGCLVCVKLSGQSCRAAVGVGEGIESGSLEELEEESLNRLKMITGRFAAETDDQAVKSAVNIASVASQAIYGDNVFIHGAVSWKEGYLGWRSTYGPIAFGMTGEVREHFSNHFRYSRITEGPDRGALCDMIEHGSKSGGLFYSMYETAVDQAKNYWEYTADSEFARDLLEVTEGCISRACRRLKPGKELLFENSLNTWISDSHWTVMGQCTQSSAYMYNMYCLAARLSGDGEKKRYYNSQADRLRRDLNGVLWLKRQGIFAYARDLRGSHLVHTQAELADIYHPIEFGLTDKYQAYQMLDWAEANLPAERTDNGGRLFWSSNWYPNAGRTYTHSTYELNMGEEMNLAMACQLTGLTEKGYEVFKTAYMSMFGGREPDIRDTDMDKYRENGHPPHLTALACDIPCQVSVNGTPRRNALFGDSVGMFGKALIEGVFGIKPDMPDNRISLSPHIPKEIRDITVKGALVSYRYAAVEDCVSIDYDVHKTGCTLCVTLALPVSEIVSVTLDGKEIPYSAEPHFCSVLLHSAVENASVGKFRVCFRPIGVKDVEPRVFWSDGQPAELEYPGEEITGVYDPQSLLAGVICSGGVFRGRVSAESGSGVFFLNMKAGGTNYIRPVPVMITDEKREKKPWRGYRETYEGPYVWSTVDIDGYFNGDSPMNVLRRFHDASVGPAPEYSQINFGYYKDHLTGRNMQLPSCPVDDSRWRGLVGEDGIAVTGEGIPFRSKKEGDYLAAAALNNTAYPDRITVPVNEAGRAVYLMISGITFPMQSGVENLRVTLCYEDGVTEIHPLVNPYDIGDMWSTIWRRWHDTPANGFERLGGYEKGPDSSAGLDLTVPIETGTEAHILHFPLRADSKLRSVEMKIIANDVLFALMGVTILK